MKTLKVAIVSDAVMPFHKGGKEMRIYHLTKELVRLGFQVDIYTMKWWTEGKTYQENDITYHAISRRYALYAGSRRSIPQAVLFGLSCLKMVHYNFDILEVDHMPVFPLFSAKVVSTLKRRPLYATWHEVWGKRYWQTYLGTYKGFIAYCLEWFSVFMPDHVVAVSKQTQQQLRTVLHYHGPISLVGNAVDTKQIEAIPPAQNMVDVLYVGRLLSHKNVDLLIKAVGKVKPAFPKIRCAIIGKGPEGAALKDLIEKLKLSENVRMVGFVTSDEDVKAQMKSSRVFASPSSREGYGITVLEALACGSRIVTVNSSENAARFLVNEDNGTVCAPTVDDLAKALTKELQKATGTRSSIERFDAYDWSFSAQQLSEAYAS